MRLFSNTHINIYIYEKKNGAHFGEQKTIIMLLERIYYRGAITAYYKANGSIIRYPLFRTEEKNISKVRCRLKNNPSEYDCDTENLRIDELETKINSAIVEILKREPKAKLTIKKIKDEIGVIKIESKGIVDDLNTFIEERRKEYIKENPNLENQFPSGLKDYRSLKNALADFQYDEKRTLTLADIDEDFLDEFVDYLFDEKPKISEDGYKYKSQGNLANKTLNKRLESFSAFIRAFYKNESIATLVYSRRYSLQPNDVIRITKEELETLANMKMEGENDNIIRDFFVFLCLTGLRFSDFISLNKQHFQISRGKATLRIKTQKTNKIAEIPLADRAYSIAKKYKFNFNVFINQLFNRYLKDMLARHQLFEDEIGGAKMQRRKSNDYICMRREKISAHTGRRTFISILVEQGVPLQMIMSMTGHTQVKTLQIYIDKFSPEKRKYLEGIFNI
ncbi:MAG TPA: hypothetical protein DIT04_05325 [Dysgonomonas sp.]|nr:hypothetical protein [Dysgonomonas sp.]